MKSIGHSWRLGAVLVGEATRSKSEEAAPPLAGWKRLRIWEWLGELAVLVSRAGVEQKPNTLGRHQVALAKV